LKSKVALAIILTCIIAGVAAGSYVQATSGFHPQTFTLTATGKAYDPSHHQVTVSLTVIGPRDGSLTMVLNVHVSGGDVVVQNYGTFPVSKGYGIVVQRFHFISIWIKITGKYGGQTAVWLLGGETGTFAGKNLPVSLYADKVILPLHSSPKLDDLNLKGTLTLN